MKSVIMFLSALCLAVFAAAMPTASPPLVKIEKVVALDAPATVVSSEFAVCDFDSIAVPVSIGREAVSYVARESSNAGRSAVTYAKVSAHGRTCIPPSSCTHRSTLTDYEQRM